MTQLKQGRTESLQWRLWQPLYGPCMTLEHSYSQLESAVCWFLVTEVNRRTQRKTLEAEKKTNASSTHLWRRVRKSNPGHIGGRRALSPLHHPCFPCCRRYNHQCNFFLLYYQLSRLFISNLNLYQYIALHCIIFFPYLTISR